MNLLKQPTYWLLPEWGQDLVTNLVPKKKTWTLTVFKCDDGKWMFHYPPFIWNEGLVNGTEKVLDHWYKQMHQKDSTPGDKMKMTVSTEEMTEYTTTVLYIQDDPMWMDSTEYMDTKTDLTVWLCPVLQVMFGYKPDKMWVMFEPTD